MICAHEPGTHDEAIEMGCPCCDASLLISRFKTVHSEPVCASFMWLPAEEFIERCAVVLKSVLVLKPN